LLGFRQVAREEFGAGGEHPGQIVGDLHAAEDVDGYLLSWSCTVSPASGATAAM